VRGRRGDAAGAGNGSEPIVEPPTYDPDRPTDAGTATILRDGSDDTDADPEIYDDLSAAVDAAGPGDTIELSGVFEPAETVIVDEPGMTIRAASTHDALIDGGGEDTTIAVRAPNATVEGVWIDDTGENLESQDAAVYVAENATGTTLTDLYLTDAAFGVWVNGADQVTIADSRIEGTQAPRFANRGNGSTSGRRTAPRSETPR